MLSRSVQSFAGFPRTSKCAQRKLSIFLETVIRIALLHIIENAKIEVTKKERKERRKGGREGKKGKGRSRKEVGQEEVNKERRKERRGKREEGKERKWGRKQGREDAREDGRKFISFSCKNKGRLPGTGRVTPSCPPPPVFLLYQPLSSSSRSAHGSGQLLQPELLRLSCCTNKDRLTEGRQGFLLAEAPPFKQLSQNPTEPFCNLARAPSRDHTLLQGRLGTISKSGCKET